MRPFFAGLIGTASLIFFVFSLALVGLETASVLAALLGAAAGIAAVAGFRPPLRAGLAAVCLIALTTYPMTYAALATFSNAFVRVHGYLWIGGWFAFLGLAWYPCLPRLRLFAPAPPAGRRDDA